MRLFIHQPIVVLAAAALLLTLTGCEDEASVQTQDGKLTLTKPSTITLERGGTAKVEVKISRENVKGPVAVKFDKLPAGVSVVDKDKKITGDSAVFVLEASDSADLVEDHHAQVTVEADEKGTLADAAVSQPLVVTVKVKT